MDNASNLTVDKTNHYSKNWLLRNEPRLFILSLLGQILGFVLLTFGLSFLKMNEVSFWPSYAILAVPAMIVGFAASLRPGPNNKRNRVLKLIPALAAAIVNVVFLIVTPRPISDVPSTIAANILMGILLGMGLFEKRLDAQPRKKRLWILHLVLSSLLMMAYIWGAYEYMVPLA